VAINYCTIGTTTIDSFCGTQRAKVLARLILEARPDIPPTETRPPAGGGWAIPTRPELYPATYRPPELEQPPLNWEQPFVSVTVEMDGVQGIETQEMSTRFEFVVVTDLEISSDDDLVTVNISELEITT
jgi:hypothetical protein